MLLYFLFLLGVGITRLYEVRLSQSHFAKAKSEHQAYAVQDSSFPLMVVFHPALLIFAFLEAWLLDRPFVPFLGYFLILIWLLTFLARLWVLKTMRENWNVRVIHHPEQQVVQDGPYQFIRHPNYVIVMIEVFTLPMIHCAYLTAILGTILNAAIIAMRLKTEETYLASLPGYNEVMGNKPRFIPHKLQIFFSQIIQKARAKSKGEKQGRKAWGGKPPQTPQ